MYWQKQRKFFFFFFFTGSKIRWNRPILSITHAFCCGTNRTTVFMGKREDHRCWAGVPRSLGAVLREFCQHRESHIINKSLGLLQYVRSQYITKSNSGVLSLNNNITFVHNVTITISFTIFFLSILLLCLLIIVFFINTLHHHLIFLIRANSIQENFI